MAMTDADEDLRAARRAFVENHRTGIYGYDRRKHPPSMSVVYYQLEGSDILVSTMGRRAKALAARANGQASLCVLDEKWPLSYVLLYCNATVEDNFAATVTAMMRVREIMAGAPMPEDVRPIVEQTARDEERVLIRLRPYLSFATPPRHVYRPEDNVGLTHSLGRTVPW